MSTDASFYWFDYETFGLSPAWDKPAQFAGQRTTLDLEPIGEPVILYCKPPSDYLPNPHACRVTGMQPDDINNRGLVEPEFIKQVVAELGKPGTCSVGYNSIRFDDEFTRHTLFRNFHDPYEYEWKNGNSRWDLLDVVRLARALRPTGINWPTLPDGTPTNKLELLSQLNGIEHVHAHDALSDVEATIGMARLLKQTQPKLFNYAFTHRDKKSVAAILNYRERKPCVHVSGMIPGKFGHTSVIVPVCRHPVNQNGVIVLDLRTDPDLLFSLSEAEIAERVFSSAEQLGDKERIHLRTVQINKCPVLVPMATLRPQDAERLNIDLTEQLERAARLSERCTEDAAEVIRRALTVSWPEGPNDVDASLYAGAFFNTNDKQLFKQVIESQPEQLHSFDGLFNDPRGSAMLLRYRARNFPQTLTSDEQADWQEYCADKLFDNNGPWLSADKFKQAMTEIDWQPGESELKQSLDNYAQTVLNAARVKS